MKGKGIEELKRKALAPDNFEAENTLRELIAIADGKTSQKKEAKLAMDDLEYLVMAMKLWDREKVIADYVVKKAIEGEKHAGKKHL